MKKNSITGGAKPRFINGVPGFFGALIILSLTALQPGEIYAQAPTISYASPQTYTAGTPISSLTPASSGVAAPGFGGMIAATATINQPTAVAVDAVGNIFITTSYYGDIVEAPGGSTTTINGLGSSLYQPTALAIDAAGNFYVVDTGYDLVEKIPAGGGAGVPLAYEFMTPRGVAVDAAGNVYVSDFGTNTVFKIPGGSGAPIAIGSSFNGPYGLAADAAGNIYVADYNNNQVKKIPAAGGNPVAIASGLTGPTGIAVDIYGNVYVSGSDNTLKKIPVGGGAIVTLASGLSTPEGVAVGPAGNIYVADYGNNIAREVKATGGYYISPALPQGLSINATTGVISGTATAAIPTTIYTVTACNASGSASATVTITVNLPPKPTISYTAPPAYTAGTAISPLVPTVTHAGTPGYASPVIVGPQISAPTGVTVDSDNFVYVTSAFSPTITKFSLVGGLTSYVGSGFSGADGIVLDKKGNIFVADANNGLVKEIPKGSNTPVSLNATFGQPHGLAFDTAGYLYAGDFQKKLISTFYPGSTSTDPYYEYNYGVSPEGMAFDAAGNFYVAGFNYGLIMLPISGGGAQLLSTQPLYALASDASGNIYGSSFATGSVVKMPPGGGAATTIGTGFHLPNGIALDVSGNVYVADYGNNAIKEMKLTGGYTISPSLPAGLKFDGTTGIISGTPVAAMLAKTFVVTAVNLGGATSTSVTITIGLPPNPTLSYNSPNIYTTGSAITPLAPVSSNIGSPGYGNGINFSVPGNSPEGVALDAFGNLYISTLGYPSIIKVPAGGGASVNLGSGFEFADAVAVDASGNVYVANDNDEKIYKIPSGGGTPVVIGSGYSSARGIAVDASGNVFVSDLYANVVYKIPAGGGAQTTFASGFNYPEGLAIDAAGNVYVADSENGVIKKIPAAGGTPVIVASGFQENEGVAIDAANNIYVSQYYLNTITKVPADGSARVVFGVGIRGAGNLAVDAVGNVYAVDSQHGLVKEFKLTGGYYISPVLPAGLSINKTTGVISGTPTVVSPGAYYTINAFNAAGSVSASASIRVNPPAPTLSYSSPHTYALNTAITPLAPTSTGVAAAAYSGGQSVLTSSVPRPFGLAVDLSGNVYIGKSNSSAIIKVPAGGGAAVSYGSGFSSPVGVATDAAGNVYVADYGGHTVQEIPAGGGTPIAIGSGFVGPYGLAVDALGNIYVADFTANAVYKVPAGGGTPVSIGSGFSDPAGVAVDALGNVYVADAGNNAVKEIPGGVGAPVTLGSGFHSPHGVTVDYSGNIFIADSGNGRVVELPTGGGQAVMASGFSLNIGVAVDQNNVVYMSSNLDDIVYSAKPSGGYYINAAVPAGLTFNNTTGVFSGTPTAVSAAKNYIVTGYNTGGQASAVVNIAVTGNATLSALKLSAGTLSPAFSATGTSYTASVGNSIPSITVTPTAADPNATIKVNGTSLASGTASASIPLNVGANTITTVVTAQDGTTTKTYSIIVTRAVSSIATLSSIGPSIAPLTPLFSPNTTSYTLSVSNATATMTVKPVTTDANATIKLNGTVIVSGTASGAIPLAEGTTTAIIIAVTAQDGTTTKTYTITVTRAPSSDATLTAIGPSIGPLTPVFTPNTTGYALSVSNATATMTVKPVTTDANATINLNGAALTSGTTSAAIALAEGTTTAINVAVTAQDGTTIKTYTITVTRAPSSVATLSSIGSSITPLTPVFNSATISYTLSVPNGTTTMTVKPVTTDANATIKVNGTALASGTTSGPIALAVGSNTISTVVTAQDGITTKTYTLTVTRAASLAHPKDAIVSVTIPIAVQKVETPVLADDGIIVHQGISPNGDGINDFLQIDNISQFPDNKLTIMNRNGQLVFEAKAYDNNSKVFDGHSNKNGRMQLPGTYFYQLDYSVNGIIKHKTGFIVLKY